jgi:hypothetical protein
MRFTRRERFGEFQWTSRKEAAARRSLKREQERLPLFAAQIAEEQPSIEEIRRRRTIAWTDSEQTWRQLKARHWRQARSRLRLEPVARQKIMLEYWNTHRWYPGDPLYLIAMLNHPPIDLLEKLAAPSNEFTHSGEKCPRP